MLNIPVKIFSSLILCFFLFFVGNQNAEALNFATYDLEDLADNSDAIIVGTVEKSKKASQEYIVYQIETDQVIKGDIVAGDTIPVKVLQWADEGILDSGDRYLLLLYKMEDESYSISGVHQGFIKLKNGVSESRFYSAAEVDQFIKKNAVHPDATAQETDKPTSSNGGSPWLSKSAIILAAILIGIGIKYQSEKRT
jgi:hypothetical protein